MFKLILAIVLGKLIYFVSRYLKLGGGSAAPGLYALKIDPELVTKLASQIPQNVVITGTNGKTTTSNLLTAFIQENGLKVLNNSTGSNLERGVASSLVSSSHLTSGKLKNVEIGVWELDEAAFNSVVFKIKPQIVVFLNAYRDQLDRYGEVDTIIKKWNLSIKKMDWSPLFIVNQGDSTLSSLELPKMSGYKVWDHRIRGEHADKKFDGKPEVGLKIKKDRGMAGYDILIDYPGGRFEGVFGMPGKYNLNNLLAGFAIYFHLNLSLGKLRAVMANFRSAFGRVEKLDFRGTETYIFLIKNPVGATQVFETVESELKDGDVVLIALNDNFADGKDVSWIWDADFEAISYQLSAIRLVVSGTRAEDMAVRLKYAGFSPENMKVINNLESALVEARKHVSGRLFILPTYTALLGIQKILAGAGVKEHYWKEG